MREAETGVIQLQAKESQEWHPTTKSEGTELKRMKGRPQGGLASAGCQLCPSSRLVRVVVANPGQSRTSEKPAGWILGAPSCSLLGMSWWSLEQFVQISIYRQDELSRREKERIQNSQAKGSVEETQVDPQ